MADKPKKKKRKMKEAEAVEVHDDAWERFESTVREIVRPSKPGATFRVLTERGSLKVDPGDKVEIEVEGGRIVASRLQRPSGETFQALSTPVPEDQDSPRRC